MRLRITAPARLHFGLLQIDPTKPHCYGGLGLMLQTPCLRICVGRSDHSEVHLANDIAERPGTKEALEAKVFDALYLARDYFVDGSNKVYQLTVEAMPRLHCGLGTGTQLACAVVTGIAALRQFELAGSICDHAQGLWESIVEGSTPHLELSTASGRGKRSHIGIEGFLSGGWIFDEGGNVLQNQTSARASTRSVSKWEFPETWQVLLFLNDQLEGLSGTVEQASFDRGQSDNGEVSNQMYALAVSEILPAISSHDYNQFSGAIRRYNQLAGELFIQRESPSRIQRYANQLGNVMSELSIDAFGQTSWGPTMWAVVPRSRLDQGFAELIQTKLKCAGLEHVSVQVTDVCANGASIEVLQ
jgi:beta-RFAP synthase